MKILKRLFSAQTKDLKYTKEIIILFSLILILVFPVLLRLFAVEMPFNFIWYILGLISALSFYPCMVFSGMRLLSISDNIKKKKMKDNTYVYKAKYEPILLNIEEILLLFKKTDVCCELVLKNCDRYYVIGVDFEYYKSKKLNDKKFYSINGKEIDNFSEFNLELVTVLNTNLVCCLAIDDNNPIEVWNKIKIN